MYPTRSARPASRVPHLSTTLVTVLMAVAILLSFTCSHAIDTPARTGAGRTVSVGIYETRPLAYTDPDGSAHGFFVEMFNYIAEKEQWNVQYVPGSWQEGLDRLESGRVDMVLCIAYTEARDRYMDFPKEFLLLDWGLIFKAKGSKITSLLDLEGKSVSILKGDVYSTGFQELVSQFNIQVKLQEVNQPYDVFKAVDSGAADAGVNGNLYGILSEKGQNMEQTPIIFTPVKLGYAVNEGKNGDLIAALDRHIAAMKADKTSRYYRQLEHLLGKKDTNIAKEVYWVLSGVAAALFLAMAFIALLSQQVKAKTAHLEKEIVERKQAEGALLESEQFLKILLESLPIPVFYKDAEGRYKGFNKTFETFFGMSRSEVIDRSVFDINPPELAKIYHEKDKDLFEKVSRQIYESQLKSASGELRNVVFHKATLTNASGAISGLVGAIMDITQHKMVEEALRESEERFKALHNASFGGIAIHDQEVILECNQGLAEISGYSIEELIGMDVLQLISEKTGGLVLQNIRDGYEKTYEAIGLRKNNEEYPIRLEGRNIPYKGKNVRVVEFRDITEQKRQEEKNSQLEYKLHQSRKMEAVGQLAGGVAHDFNNMLGVIIGYSELILEQVDPSQQFHAELVEVLKAARRSADLTQRLLTFARKQTVAPRVLDLNHTIEGMLKMLRRLIGENINLIWMPGSGLWPINMDPSQIDQILANLCVNARDAIADVGKLTVETENATFDREYCAAHAGALPGEYVRISVSDTGSGMDKETLAHIFEPFFTTKNVGEGTGLGLATVYGAVKQNNGFVNAYSEPGQGTTFTIYIPRHVETTTETQATVSPGPVMRGDEIVLLVEDEPTLLHMSKTMLERLGYTVLAADTPSEAIRLAGEYSGQIHLLATDVIMPEMNGRELSARLLENRTEMKCLYMSGYTANIIANQGVLKEGVSFIQKPFSKNELAAKVREAMEG